MDERQADIIADLTVTYGGKVDIGRDDIDFADPGVLHPLIEGLAAQYREEIDED